MSWMILFKKQLFDLEVKGHGPTKIIMVRDTPPYGHAYIFVNLDAWQNLLISYMNDCINLNLKLWWKQKQK
jgi:hypothetical protein